LKTDKVIDPETTDNLTNSSTDSTSGSDGEKGLTDWEDKKKSELRKLEDFT
jgi:hypothetical protein